VVEGEEACEELVVCQVVPVKFQGPVAGGEETCSRLGGVGGALVLKMGWINRFN
jgi:hypothetical protein